MYAATQSNDIRSLTATAQQFGITLPGNIPKMVSHLRDMQAAQGARPDLDAYATDLAQHLGNPAAMTRARKAAAHDLAEAEAHQRITGPLLDRCVAVTFREIRRANEEIVSLFADALAPHLAILNTEADLLPAGFKPEHAADLDPARFESWTRARDAHAVLTAARKATAMLYGRAISDNLFTVDAQLALAYANTPSRFTDYTHAHQFARALSGVRHGGSNLGVVNIDGVFAPTALARLGATFEWAGPSEVARRLTTITQAAVQPKTERVAV